MTLPRALSAPLPMPPTRAGKRGKVVLSFIVMPDGSVRDINFVKRFRPDFDAAAVNAVSKWKFAPGTQAGKPLPMRLETEIKFTPLKDEKPRDSAIGTNSSK